VQISEEYYIQAVRKAIAPKGLHSASGSEHLFSKADSFRASPSIDIPLILFNSIIEANKKPYNAGNQIASSAAVSRTQGVSHGAF
jgi:hypothetical protein